MDKVLHLYENEPTNDKYLLVCMDETSVQLLGETRPPIPVKPGYPNKIDNEYKRNGTKNIFVFLANSKGERILTVTDRRTRIDWAKQVHKLIYKHYPERKKSSSFAII
jgi:hypothetical protein